MKGEKELRVVMDAFSHCLWRTYCLRAMALPTSCIEKPHLPELLNVSSHLCVFWAFCSLCSGTSASSGISEQEIFNTSSQRHILNLSFTQPAGAWGLPELGWTCPSLLPSTLSHLLYFKIQIGNLPQQQTLAICSLPFSCSAPQLQQIAVPCGAALSRARHGACPCLSPPSWQLGQSSSGSPAFPAPFRSVPFRAAPPGTPAGLPLTTQPQSGLTDAPSLACGGALRENARSLS